MSVSATERGSAARKSAVRELRADARRARVTAISYLYVTAACMLFERVYTLFAHGVDAPAMTWMFLYPLLGGVLPFALGWLRGGGAHPVPRARFLYNAYNSGIAALTAASALTGVFEIAGTSSAFPAVLYALGAAACALGAAGYAAALLRQKPRQ